MMQRGEGKPFGKRIAKVKAKLSWLNLKMEKMNHTTM